MAGEMGAADTAAFALVMNFLIFSFLFSSAMGDSIGIRMAQSLGDGDPERASFQAWLGTAVSVAGSVVIALAVFGLVPGLCKLMSQESLWNEERLISYNKLFLN